jgi:dirigent-like protein
MSHNVTRRDGIAGVALLGALAAIGVAYAAAPGSAGVVHSTKAQRTTTLRFDEKGSYYKVIDNPPADTTPNPETGDTILYRSDLVSGNRKIGTAQGFCTMVDAPAAQCAATLFLPSGHLVFLDSFVVAANGRNEFAMIGGTGAYEGARGEALITQVTPTEFRWVVKVRRGD